MKNNNYKISDIGDRTEFKTGAVRDLKKGKGRFFKISPSHSSNSIPDFTYPYDD